MTHGGTRRIVIAAAVGLALWPAAASANTYVVTIGTADNVDNTDNGICGDPSGVCSLRAAIETANGAGSPGFDTIEVPYTTLFGPYTLTRPNPGGTDENAAHDGDLDLITNMEIKGTGGTPTIQGDLPAFTDRIFHIPSGSPTVTLTNLNIERGQAPEGRWGGGIKHESGSLAISDATISDNRALGNGARGGGIYSAGGSSLTLTDSTVGGNQAPPDASVSNGAQGGGIWTSTPVTLNRVSIHSNNANFGCGPIACGGNGGGLFNAGGGTLTNVTVTGNIAGGNSTSGSGGGGGIAQAGGALTLVNSTIEHNYTMGPNGVGGGNLASGSDLFLQNTIISNGETIDRAAGTENCGNDTGSPTAFNTLGGNLEALAGLGPAGASQCSLNPGTAGDLTAASAGLGTFDLHGGTTPTYALQPGSPAIDAGGPSGPAIDQRGVARPQGSRCDIGAYEVASVPPPVGFTCAGAPPQQPTEGGPSGPSPAPKAAKCKKKKKQRAATAKKKRCKKKRRR